jgi:hypothetical protein
LHELAFDDDLELWKGRGSFKKHIKTKTDRTGLVLVFLTRVSSSSLLLSSSDLLFFLLELSYLIYMFSVPIEKLKQILVLSMS